MADVGRWASTDPAKEFHNSYRYTTNPIGFIDPNGLAELRYALYLTEMSDQSQAIQDYYGQFVPEGDNLVVKSFSPEQKTEMIDFLKGGDKSAVGAHSYKGAEGIYYETFDNLIKFTDLNFEMSFEDKVLYIDACFAEENLPAGQDVHQNLKAADGASGLTDVTKAGMKSLGVNAPDTEKNK